MTVGAGAVAKRAMYWPSARPSPKGWSQSAPRSTASVAGLTGAPRRLARFDSREDPCVDSCIELVDNIDDDGRRISWNGFFVLECPSGVGSKDDDRQRRTFGRGTAYDAAPTDTVARADKRTQPVDQQPRDFRHLRPGDLVLQTRHILNL